MKFTDLKERFVSLERDGEIHVWFTKRLWELSNELPVFDFRVSEFDSFDKDVWFGDQHLPTVAKVLEHYRRISNADFTYPIIFSQDGSLFDGVHRVCRAHLEGQETIRAVKFAVDPAPDRRYPLPNLPRAE